LVPGELFRKNRVVRRKRRFLYVPCADRTIIWGTGKWFKARPFFFGKRPPKKRGRPYQLCAYLDKDAEAQLVVQRTVVLAVGGGRGRAWFQVGNADLATGYDSGGRGRWWIGACRVFQPAAPICASAKRSAWGGKYCLLTVGLSLPALIGVLIIGLQGDKAPLINDITTDTTNPPPFEKATQLRRPGDNSTLYPGERAAGQQRLAFPDIGPLTVTSAPTSAFEKSRTVIERLGWRVVAQNPEQGLIEAVDRSLIFGFIDDIVIRIAPSGSGSRIDVRSASRAGIGDLGVNAKRIRSFFSTYNAMHTP
jgi:uncharacterized protein (DUF1499 family)